MTEKNKIPNINKMFEEYDAIKNSFEDLKTIILKIPLDLLSLENINSLNNSLQNLKITSEKVYQSFKDSENMYDFFETGSESKRLCNKLKIDEKKLFEMKATFENILNFDIKQFILEYKKD